MKCDELKSLKNIEIAFNTTTQQEQVIAEDSEGNCYGFDSWEEVYLKDSVDEAIAELKAKLEGAKNETNYWCNNLKVFAQKKDAEIAELKADYKEACGRLQTANLIKDEQIAATRHSKLKRCLNKAEWCEERCARYDLLQEHSGFSWRREIDFYFRWYQRWLELAEKFKDKEAK